MRLIIATIALVAVILGCNQVQCQAPDLGSIRFYSVNGNQLFDANRLILRNYSYNCLEGAESTLGPDGWIYGYVQSRTQGYKMDLVTGDCKPIPLAYGATAVSSLIFSPSGNYLHFILDSTFGNSANRVLIGDWTALNVLQDPDFQVFSIDFSNIGYMFVTWRGSNNSHGGVRFSYNTGDDSFVQEEFQSWNSNADAALQRCGSCPIGFTNSTCCVGWQLVYAMSIFGDYGDTIMDTYRGGVVGVYFYHLVSTPWGGAYASTNWGGVYRYDVSAFPILDRSSEWINNTTLQFFTFLEPPYVPTEWMGRQNNQNLWCFKDISFPFYNWTKIVIFETAYGLEGNFAELSRSEGVLLTNVITEINCSNKTNVYRARVKYIGDNNVNIYTLPSVIRCSDAPAECLVPASFNDIPPAPQNVPNIIPILECITAETTNNFTVYFGYNNTENSLYNVPIGPLNTFSATQDRGQTTNFLTGRSRYWPTTAFTAQFSAGTFSWRLTNYNLTFTTTDQSLACPTNITLRVTLRTSTNFIITQEELGLIGINIANQLGLDPSQVTVRLVVSGNKKRQSNSDISELEVEISTSSPNQNTPSQSPAQIVQNFVQITSNDTLAQQTFNPLNDTSRSVVSVDTTKTGREQSGSRVSDTNNQPTTEPSTEPITNNQPKGTAKTPVVSEAVSFGNNIALFVGLFVVTVLKKIFI